MGDARFIPIAVQDCGDVISSSPPVTSGKCSQAWCDLENYEQHRCERCQQGHENESNEPFNIARMRQSKDPPPLTTTDDDYDDYTTPTIEERGGFHRPSPPGEDEAKKENRSTREDAFERDSRHILSFNSSSTCNRSVREASKDVARPPRKENKSSAKPLLFIGVLLALLIVFIAWLYGFSGSRVVLLSLHPNPSLPSSPLPPAVSAATATREQREHRDATDDGGRNGSDSKYEIVHVLRIKNQSRQKRSHHGSTTTPAGIVNGTEDAKEEAKEQQSVSYVFEAFGRTVFMDLEKLGGFYLHNLPIVRFGGGSRPPLEQLKSYLDDEADADGIVNRCFHYGHVRGDPDSKAVVGLCNHMSGIIEMFDKRYVIEPLASSASVTTPTVNSQTFENIEHVIYEMERVSFDDLANDGRAQSSPSSTSSSSSLLRRTNHKAENRETKVTRGMEKSEILQSRVKRSTSLERNVEMMIAVDHLMESFHGERLEEYLLTLISIVSSIYNDKSVGNYINIVLVKIIILDEETSSNIITPNPKTTLFNFSKWQRKMNVNEDGEVGHWDTAVLLTRVDLCSSSQNCDILGLAELGAMCESSRSCSIAEDSGLSSAFTIAHELGHVLGITHDEGECLTSHAQHFTIMARTMDQHGKSWCWSDCSRERLSNFLDSGKGDCLLNVPVSFKSLSHLIDKDGVPKQAGSIYSADQQCVFVFGEGYSRCPFAPTCSILWCQSKNKSEDCESVHMQWADGTPCSQDSNYACLNGKCVKREKMVRQDGQWGAWQPYDVCTRTCGGGIQKSIRLCNNPEPQNGGRYCLGRRTKYKSCNLEDCPDHAEDFREIQCMKFNGNHFNISGLDNTVRWVAKFSDIKPSERCKLYCRVQSSDAYYRLRERVIDGTKCAPDGSDVCIFGQCKKAGCDNQLGSNVTYDRCGICGGDNSQCREVHDEFPRTSKIYYGYNPVVLIPRGATHIDIRQYSQTGDEKDNTYLALMEPSGEFLINGHFSVCYYKKEVKLQSGGMLQYSGAHVEVERINITASLKTDLYVYVLTVGDNLLAPIINWTYTERVSVAPRRNVMFEWSPLPWSDCSKMCQGTTTKATVCIRNDTGSVVSDHHCHDFGNKPKDVKKPCNTNCELRWEVYEKSECQAACGNWGVAMQMIKCVREELSDRSETEVAEENCENSRPQAKLECFRECDTPKWWYSDWSQCSVSCGGGEQSRSVRCKDGDGFHVDNYECGDGLEHLVRVCNLQPCPVWIAGDWSECSVTCGSGVKTRLVKCTQLDESHIEDFDPFTVSDSQCNLTERPANEQPCFVPDCRVTHSNDQPLPTIDKNNARYKFNWVSSDWSECSQSCNEGFQIRRVTCKDWLGMDSEDEFCNSSSRPHHEQSCNVELCPVWVHGEWGPCTVTCGIGQRRRLVLCYPIGFTSEACNPLEKPDSLEDCSQIACPLHIKVSNNPYPRQKVDFTTTPTSSAINTTISNDIVPLSSQTMIEIENDTKWVSGDWSECSVTCGKGLRHRQVNCLNSMGDVVPGSSCDSLPRPQSEDGCAMPSCAEWRTGDWTECSASCGGGKQLRHVACRDWMDQDYEETHCNSSIKPGHERRCNVNLCPIWVHGEWSQCSQSCNNGIQMRHVACQDWTGRETDENYCNITKKPITEQLCNTVSCPVWVYGEWSECSATCGGGVQNRVVVCQWSQRNLFEAPQEICHDPRPSTFRECQKTSCLPTRPRWVKKPWSQCSVTCGKGKKTREVLCIDKVTSAVTDGRCRGRKPDVTTQCHRGDCHKWDVSSWSKCSRTCEGGVQKRRVSCIDKTLGEKVPNRSCKHLEKPISWRRCNSNVSCHSIVWWAGDWSQCSATCGHGIKLRTVKCVEVLTGIERKYASCANQTKPRNKTECFLRHCPYKWLTSDWTQCSRTCGAGIEKRMVSCRAVSLEGRMLPNSRNMSLCDPRQRPPVERLCNLGGCHEGFRWQTEAWSPCSTTCGVGQMSRNIYCISSKGRVRVDSSMCIGAIRPDSTKACVREQCYPTSCDDLRRNSMVRMDGDYILMIRGILVYIYCHGMSTSKPKEYISMMSDDNYSEIYDKRLIRLNTCPNNGTRLAANCSNCFQSKTNQQSGFTRFDKIRLNITSLQVIVNDFTFATKTGLKAVPYATAGDCYSKMKSCPQGSFSINLSGTMFSVSVSEKWVAYGTHAHVAVNVRQPHNRQIVRGKCGGYCGGCKPSRDGVLQLEIYQ